MLLVKKILIIFFAVFYLVGCDISTKHIAQRELKGRAVQSYLGGNLKLFYTENSGGMLSIGSEFSEGLKFAIFQIFVAIILLILFFYTVKKKGIGKLQTAAFVLFLGGGFGNLIDRIINNGKVVDFIVIELFGYHTGVFNIADFYITLGVVILIMQNLFFNKPTKEITLTTK